MTLAGQCLFLGMTTLRLAALAIPAPIGGGGARGAARRRGPAGLHGAGPAPPRGGGGAPSAPALAALDYPAAKLDIKLLLEADDADTASVLAGIPLPARFEVVTVPPGAPRTKPRALNAALPLARGALLTVYDAEDVPDPGQLRLAAALFARLPGAPPASRGGW